MQGQRTTSLSLNLLGRLARDESGVSAIIFGLLSMLLLGFAALGADAGYWYFNTRNMQAAADSAAMSAVTSIVAAPDRANNAADPTSEARATAARYGFTNGAAVPTISGSGTVSVTVNNPPKSGPSAGNNQAVEVIITEPQPMFLSAALRFGGTPVFANNPTGRARAVGIAGSNGPGCVVALDHGAVEDLFDNGNTQLNLQGCSLYINSTATNALDQVGNATISALSAYVVGGISDTANASITTTKGTFQNTGAPINDPYANVQPPPIPGSCSHDATGLTPGLYGTISGCLAWNPNGTLQPGVYVIEGGCVCWAGNTAVVGNGVTIYLTGNATVGYATMKVTGNATLTLTPPTSGNTAGIAIFQDRNAPQNTAPSTNQLGGNGNMNILGVIYFPNQGLTFNGNAANNVPYCTQIVALTLTFHGNSQVQNDCFGTGTHAAVAGVNQIGAIPAKLTE